MRTLEWDNTGVKIDGRQLHHLRFANYIVLITTSITQAERMLVDFDKLSGKIGLRFNLTKMMFMRNGLVSHAPFTLNGTNISVCFIYIYLGREINMMNDLAPELNRRKRVAWEAFKSIGEVVRKTKNSQLRAHLFDSTVLPALTYASETWSMREQHERSFSFIEHEVERTTLGASRIEQVGDGIRSSDHRLRSKIKDAVLYDSVEDKVCRKHNAFERQPTDKSH
ncbi:unnamed protein product [Angiostrongylus costaricensis]|uniref:Reverse transcriptase domain-containing protein n=1 Tax=Angiostrongylus costaricensis TaxID=334426 RepID=A0A0R3PNX5_ANGCS|nr:unnamed protein product [Angiostrongylus costaricensis]